MLPKPKPNGEPMLTDVETRFRKRYLGRVRLRVRRGVRLRVWSGGDG
jgi:hypothetical protein